MLFTALSWTALASSGVAGAVIRSNQVFTLDIPASAEGASIELDNSFASFSIEPAFWTEFIGNVSNPNELTTSLLDLIVQHGGQPNIRPGGITMDSMIFNENTTGIVRTTSSTGGVYRTTVGPGYYESWSNLPNGTKFISTLNLGNNSLPIAQGLAVASVKYQGGSILAFELGNEPTNYPASRWNDSTATYVAQWKDWTAHIDAAVNATGSAPGLGSERWFASSATTDVTALHVQPVDLIPAGIDSRDQVSFYSIHSYPFSSCDPTRAKLATIPNILNHTGLAAYADDEIYPSAKAALDAGSRWVIGEFNSISCSGNPNVSDTFAQALWALDSDLIYATRNASNVYLHQGATLALQSGQQVNTAGPNGSPGFSTYDFVYPRDSPLRGKARALPSFLAQLVMAEAFASGPVRVRELATPAGLNQDSFSAYAFYEAEELKRLAIINSALYFANSTSDGSVSVDVTPYTNGSCAYVKRLTSPSVDEKDSAKTTWAGQAFPLDQAVGEVDIEETQGCVSVRASEAVLVFFDQEQVLGL